MVVVHLPRSSEDRESISARRRRERIEIWAGEREVPEEMAFERLLRSDCFWSSVCGFWEDGGRDGRRRVVELVCCRSKYDDAIAVAIGDIADMFVGGP